MIVIKFEIKYTSASKSDQTQLNVKYILTRFQRFLYAARVCLCRGKADWVTLGVVKHNIRVIGRKQSRSSLLSAQSNNHKAHAYKRQLVKLLCTRGQKWLHCMFQGCRDHLYGAAGGG